MARVALGATAVLALAGRANAVVCAANTYYDGTTKSGGGGTTFAAGADCTACPTGTTAAGTPNGSAATFCEGIAANYYGNIGLVASKHAAVTKCPFAGTLAASSVTNDISSCTPTTNAGFAADTGSVVCAANYYGRPLDVNDAEVLTASKGCTACPTGSSTLAQTGQSTCTTSAGYYIKTASATSGGVGTLAQAPITHFALGGVDIKATGAAIVATAAEGTNYATAMLLACPTGFKTGAVGASTRQTCTKKFVAAESSTTDAYLATATVTDATNGLVLKACPLGTSSTAFTVAANTKSNPANACHATLANYYGDQGLSYVAAASNVAACPSNSVSAAGSDEESDCKCVAGYSASDDSCVVCPANTYKAAGDAVGTPTNCLGCGTGYESAAGAAACTAVAAAAAAATTSGASSASVLAAISAVAAAQLVL